MIHLFYKKRDTSDMSSMGHGSYVANLSIFYIKVGYKQYDTV